MFSILVYACLFRRINKKHCTLVWLLVCCIDSAIRFGFAFGAGLIWNVSNFPFFLFSRFLWSRKCQRNKPTTNKHEKYYTYRVFETRYTHNKLIQSSLCMCVCAPNEMLTASIYFLSNNNEIFTLIEEKIEERKKRKYGCAIFGVFISSLFETFYRDLPNCSK